jgi:[ribosomal protein S5]-alanine N-acetyltransferase
MKKIRHPMNNPITVLICEPNSEDENSFIAAMQRSQSLHYPWIKAPQTPQEFNSYIQRFQQENQKSFLVCDKEDNIAGVFNISEIVRGFFQNAYLGFYAVADYAAQGYMSAGLKLVLQTVFMEMKLHRLKANIQPGNTHSIHLVMNNGFKKEGYSPRYLQVNGKRRDHERWAITFEGWLGAIKK